MAVKRFTVQNPEVNAIKLFSLSLAKKARVLVDGKPFLPSLMFESKDGACPSGAYPNPQTLSQAGMACQGQTCLILVKKKFCNINYLLVSIR